MLLIIILRYLSVSLCRCVSNTFWLGLHAQSQLFLLFLSHLVIPGSTCYEWPSFFFQVCMISCNYVKCTGRYRSTHMWSSQGPCHATNLLYKLEQLEHLHSEETLVPHDYPYHWVILDPKSKEDKVKITNLKNLPKFQWVLLKIQSGHDSVHRWTDRQGETSIPPFQIRWSGGYNDGLQLKYHLCWYPVIISGIVFISGLQRL